MNNPQLNNDFFDLALKHALVDFATEQEAEAERIIALYSKEPKRIPPQRHLRLLKKLCKELAKSSRTPKAVVRKRAYRVAISLAALLVVLLGVTVAVGAAGFDLFAFFFDINPKYSTVEQVDSLKTKVAAEIRASNYSLDSFYFPSNVPESFTAEAAFAENKFCRVVLIDGDRSIDFRQNGIDISSGYSASFDTESKDGKQIVINGYDAYYIEDGDQILIGYSNQDTYFRFKFKNVTKATAKKIAEDLKKFSN